MLEPELADGVVAVAGHPARQSGPVVQFEFQYALDHWIPPCH